MVAGLVVLLVVYIAAVRPWLLHWGATPGEVCRSLPSDDIVPRPLSVSTRAITINAPAAEVWPWIAQIGCGRAGWYSYDLLDNGGVPSASRILPEYQDVKVGDAVPAVPDKSFNFRVVAVQPGEYLTLGGAFNPFGGQESLDPNDPANRVYFNADWTFYVEPTGPATTRLIVRFKVDAKPRLLGVASVYPVLEPLSFIMEQKMLRGIKERAEADRR